jgi:hypothetical protein
MKMLSFILLTFSIMPSAMAMEELEPSAWPLDQRPQSVVQVNAVNANNVCDFLPRLGNSLVRQDGTKLEDFSLAELQDSHPKVLDANLYPVLEELAVNSNFTGKFWLSKVDLPDDSQDLNYVLSLENMADDYLICIAKNGRCELRKPRKEDCVGIRGWSYLKLVSSLASNPVRNENLNNNNNAPIRHVIAYSASAELIIDPAVVITQPVPHSIISWLKNKVYGGYTWCVNNPKKALGIAIGAGVVIWYLVKVRDAQPSVYEVRSPQRIASAPKSTAAALTSENYRAAFEHCKYKVHRGLTRDMSLCSCINHGYLDNPHGPTSLQLAQWIVDEAKFAKHGYGGSVDWYWDAMKEKYQGTVNCPKK